MVSFVSAFADTMGDLNTVASGQNYQIHYEAKDSSVQNVQANKDGLSLVFSIQATTPVATLQLTLPRDLIDATKSDGTDDVFIVLVDGTFAAYTEKSTSSLSRTILIQLTPENKEVEVIGTHLGPTTLSTQKNNEQSVPPQTISERPVEQKLTENQTTNQKTQNLPITTQQPPGKVGSPILQVPSLQQIISVLHLDSKFLSFQINSKQLVEYSVIASIIIVIIITITSSARSTKKKQIRR